MSCRIGRHIKRKILATYSSGLPIAQNYSFISIALKMMPARSLITTHTLRTATMGRAVVGRGFSLSTSTRLGLKESSSRTLSPIYPCARPVSTPHPSLPLPPSITNHHATVIELVGHWKRL